MPKIRRKDLPLGLFNHLVDRISEREISANQLEEFANWLDTEPDVPEGRWFRKFSGMCVCRQGDLVKTFLIESQIPIGTEIK